MGEKGLWHSQSRLKPGVAANGKSAVAGGMTVRHSLAHVLQLVSSEGGESESIRFTLGGRLLFVNIFANDPSSHISDALKAR
jgi:hypothetical protein